MATDLYKYDLVIGYGIFYTFVVSTTASPIAFTYILPVTSLLVLYKNRKFMVYCGIANTLIIIASSVYHVVALGANSASDMKNYQLEVACIILCYICYLMSIQHLNESDGAMTDSIKADLHRVITTVEKVKPASNSIWTASRSSGSWLGKQARLRYGRTRHERADRQQRKTAGAHGFLS